MNLNLFKDKKKTKEFIIEILCTTCLVLTLLFLCNTLNETFQTRKNIFAAKAFLAFAIYLLFIQRPHILNYQTAIVTLLYFPIGYAYRRRYILSPDWFERDKVVVWIVYILILILTDMYVNKRFNPLQRMNKPFLCVYCFMTFSMIYYRNGSTMPVLLLLMLVVYLIPLTAAKWNRILNQIGNAWIISFFAILFQSVKLNNEVSELGRWYGCFVNLGDFGLFLGGVVAVLTFRLFRTFKRNGVRSLPFILYAVACLPLLWAILRVSTITLYIGMFFILIMFFILFTPNGTGKESVFRLFTVITVLVVICCLGLLLLKSLVLYADKEYWYNQLHEGNALIKPIANIVMRAFYMFEEPITFSDCGIFKPNSVINYLDLFTSGRLSIIKAYSAYFSFEGTSINGIDVGAYFAYNAHNSYVQTLVEYGYIAGGAHILWLIYLAVASVKRFLRSKKFPDLFMCLWMAMVLGVLTGECARLYTPIIFCTLFLSYPLIVNIPNRKKAS